MWCRSITSNGTSDCWLYITEMVIILNLKAISINKKGEYNVQQKQQQNL